MPKYSRFPRESWIPLIAGLVWLWRAPEHGFLGFVFSVIPGCLLLASGVAMLLWPGDRRISQFAALGGSLGVIFAVPAFIVVGPLSALLLIGASVAGFVTAGAYSARLEPVVDEVPPPIPSLLLSAQVAADEALLSTMHVSIRMPGYGDHVRSEREIAEAHEVFRSAGWLEKPADYHPLPPPLESPRVRDARTPAGGIHFEHLAFDSGYQPRPEEPGRERWLSYEANRTAHAWVVRHREEGRSWLVCIHGFQMGWPIIDLAAFPPSWLHHRLGLNLLIPVLPLHGRRKAGRRSGDYFVAGNLLDTIHAEAQAIWDIRRLLAWVRAQGAPSVGVLGYSLGGYNTALLASLEDDLCCAIPGIPLADFPSVLFHHGPPLQLRGFAEAGLEEDRVREVFRVVCPLALEPRVPKEGRYIFAAVGDRLVPPYQARDLWRHWDRPRIEWYQGGHITFRAHRSVIRLIGDALRESGLAA